MAKNAIFIAATGQHVGKTTTCLGIYSGLTKKFPSVGFIKPVGQQHVSVEESFRVDKDVVLFKEHFHIKENYTDMSPVIFPSGFTRDCLDGKVQTEDLENKIISSYQTISSTKNYVLVEGTGHLGVGTIVGLNNAQVAKLLNLDVVIVAPGGIGSSFDELALNINMCKLHNVNVRGVILNRVKDEKRKTVQTYITKALQRWNIPLIGCIPYNQFLSAPSMEDFENLFKSPIVSGEKHRYRHFLNTLLATSSVERYREKKVPNQLVITHATRKDIIFAAFEKHRPPHEKSNPIDLEGGMILTGKVSPSESIIDAAQKIDLPVIYAPVNSYQAMQMITHHIGKIRNEDTRKVEKAIHLVEEHIDFDLLCNQPS